MLPVLTQVDLKQIEKIVRKNVEDIVERKLKPIRKSLNIVVDFADREILKLESRVGCIERHLNLT